MFFRWNTQRSKQGGFFIYLFEIWKIKVTIQDPNIRIVEGVGTTDLK